MRAEEPRRGGLAVQGVKESTPQPLCHLLTAQRHTCATQDGSTPGHPDPHGAPRTLAYLPTPLQTVKKIFFYQHDPTCTQGNRPRGHDTFVPQKDKEVGSKV